MEVKPVDVVIPHYKGSERLLRCLETLFATDYDDFRVLLVDNGSTDGSTDEAEKKFPRIKVLRQHENLGFAGGCNAGVRASSSELVALLNDDTEVEPGWLKAMVRVIESDEKVVAVQPRLHWIKNKEQFDYAGAMGGLIDIFGYPFCYGRMFETREIDKGQYDWVEDIFWASGSACLFRRKPYLESGGLDEKFFAHQEEIDLNWRLQLMGYKIKTAPEAVVYHYAGGTLSEETLKKKYLNHRNSLMMLIKNYQLRTLLWILPTRLMLEAAAAILAVKQGDVRRISAIIGAAVWNFVYFPVMMWERNRIKTLRKLPDAMVMNNMYKGMVALQYYLFGKKTSHQLTGKEENKA
jgi:GT2 family glycosyltransferase